MLTLIREKRKPYLWMTNIVILLTMFVSIIEVFFDEYYQVLFLAPYLIMFLISYVLLGMLYYMVYSEGEYKKPEFAYLTFYIIDIINFLISLIFAALNLNPSYFILASLVFSIVRVVYFNTLWNFNLR